MTTPTLEKAAAVLENLERDGYRFLQDISGHEDSTLIAYIATAIREAEDAALERAKTIAQNEADFASRHQRPGGGPSEGQISATAIVLEIERLQSDITLQHKD